MVFYTGWSHQTGGLSHRVVPPDRWSFTQGGPTRQVVFNTCLTIFVGPEMELTCHDGTVRDLVFMQDTSNRSSLLISGGAGDCKIYVTDCETGTPIRIMQGHTGKHYSVSGLCVALRQIIHPFSSVSV